MRTGEHLGHFQQLETKAYFLGTHTRLIIFRCHRQYCVVGHMEQGKSTKAQNSCAKYLYSLSARGFFFPKSSSQRIFNTCDKYGSKFSALKGNMETVTIR